MTNNIGSAAVMGGIAAIGGGMLGLLAGSVARANGSNATNEYIAPFGVLALGGMGAGSVGFAGWAALDAAKAVAPGVGRGLAIGGALAGVAALAGIAGYGGYQLATLHR